jgi:catechol 2,3-dioxygenase-like lactoylglutathione lyase family enzyme
MKIVFMAGVAVIAADPPESRKLYVDAIGLPLESQGGGDYFSSEHVEGSKHFGVWPLAEAAQACFGTSTWPPDLAVPQVTLEFEVENADAVQAAADELKAEGFSLLHEARLEPWGQTIARLLSVEGSIVGISYAPLLHR